MHKKLAAALTISIFLISTFAIMVPVNAHFTLGDQIGTSPYAVNNFDPHYNGVIGYVWPGSGSETYFGVPNGNALNPLVEAGLVAPGYLPPYQGASPNGQVSPAPPGAPSPTWYQLSGNAYSPFGAILTGSTGDLIFAINATNHGYTGPAGTDQFYNGNWSEWDILLPPQFTGITGGQISSTLSNNYGNINVRTLAPNDRYAPGWTLVQLGADKFINFSRGLSSCAPAEAYLPCSTGEWYYARINGVTAPTIAGKYFFKMLLVGRDSDPSTEAAPSGLNYTYWVPPENWPVVLVKGEIDPAIITGTIMYGGFNQTLYGHPVQEAGEVYAQMTTKLDPYTNQPITGGTLTNAQAYFNATADGHYELEGLAPGVYTIYASAMGYPQVAIATGVTVLKGQSLHFNGYVNPGVVIKGTVYSKHSFGDEPWPYSNYIKIELYNQPTAGSGQGQLAAGITPVSWSPLPYIAANDTGTNGMFSQSTSTPGGVGSALLPPEWSYLLSAYTATYNGGEAPIPSPLTLGPGSSGAPSSGSLYGNPVAAPYVDYLTTAPNTYDPQGVGPAQTWYTTVGQYLFTYQFGVDGEYGAPENLTGLVPQIYATWVNGLTPGRYYVRAWTTQYVQTQIDGATFKEYYFDVAANEWSGDVSMPMDLLLASYVVKTVHLHDTPGTLTSQPDSTGAAWLNAVLEDANGVIWAHGLAQIYPGSTSDPVVLLFGFLWRWDGQDYGIPAGVYTPMTFVRGYVQQTFDQVALSLSGTPVYVSDHMYRGLGFNVTAYSMDWEQPTVNRNWQWPGQWFYVAIEDSTGKTIDWLGGSQEPGASSIIPTQWWGAGESAGEESSCVPAYLAIAGTCPGTYGVFFGSESGNNYEGGFIQGRSIFTQSVVQAPLDWGIEATHFESGQYTLLAYTLGYINRVDLNSANGFTYFGQKGEIVDGKINVIISANLTVTINFKKESILTETPWNMSMRVRVFDDTGNLVGEYLSSDGYFPLGQSPQYNAYTLSSPLSTGAAALDYLPAGTESVTLHIPGIPNTAACPFDGGCGDPIYTGVGPYGIPGTPDGTTGYTGTYSVEVDFVNWYNPGRTAVPVVFPGYAYPTILPDGLGFSYSSYYTPPEGLLEGESFHTVPGSPAGPFGYVGTVLAANHLGPYGQEGTWTLPNARLSGESSGIWEVDQRGYIGGALTAFTWSQERRPVSWATFTVAGAAFGNTTLRTYSLDGTYDGFLPGGTYQLTIAEPGYTTFTTPFVITDGQATNGMFLEIQRSNIPVPEFSGLAVVLLSTLAASLYILRRRRH